MTKQSSPDKCLQRNEPSASAMCITLMDDARSSEMKNVVGTQRLHAEDRKQRMLRFWTQLRGSTCWMT
ncbi:hypothetical protein DPEC_G00268350 [Dallia pectoralis]|uniref:Uncharacterized protein n=1 Tax=Dallia pectoralis TaxID=75939 RepID=A0ACC2FNV5_DALPE|nr:hypothetical protein DPEC_G00268350 [Dallia pectoralis]